MFTNMKNLFIPMLFISFRSVLVSIFVVVIPSIVGAQSTSSWATPMIARPTTASLRSICAVSSKCAWAGGSEGTVIRTIDGGSEWEKVGPLQWPKLEFRSVWAFGPHEAVIASAGSPAIILRTEDGGQSWQEVYREDAPEAFFDGLRFWDQRNGIAFSDPVNGQWLIVRTLDGGLTWQRVDPQKIPHAETGEAAFAASNSGLALATAPGSQTRLAWIGLGGGTEGPSRLLQTSDGGSTWTVQQVTEISRNASSGIFGVAFLPPKTLVVVGGDYRQETRGENHIALSTNNGLSWRLPSGPLPAGFRSGITSLPETGFVCVGPSGVEHSRDGHAWEPLAGPGFHAVTHDPEGNLWCVGSEGRIGFFRLRKQ